MARKNVLFQFSEFVSMLAALGLMLLYVIKSLQSDRPIDLAIPAVLMWVTAIYWRLCIIGNSTLVVREVTRKKKAASRP